MIKKNFKFRDLFLVFNLFVSLSIMLSCNNDDGPKNKKDETKEVSIIENKISAGYKHTIVITTDGKLYGWGDSSSGELGEKASKLDPKIISEDSWKSISCGYESTIGIKEDGTLWAMGYNNTGQLGIGNTEDTYKFTQVGSDNDWKKVELGYRHSIGLKKDGSLWAWGNNEFLQLGNGTDVYSVSPAQIGTDNDWIDISAGHNQSFGIKKDGSLWAWGYNLYGQLGIGNKINIAYPTKVESELKWKSVVTGISFTGGLKEDGSLWMWGRNYHGQLGNGKGNLTMDYDTEKPIHIKSEQPWKKISLGNGHILALKIDNSLWAWGKNLSGELGIGGETGYKVYKNLPTKINDETDWEDISAGESFSIVKKKDNSYWAFGENRSGQITSANDEENKPIKIF